VRTAKFTQYHKVLLRFQDFQQVAKVKQSHKNTPTRGRIASGATIEREIKFDLNDLPHIRLALKKS
jgi:flagellar basal body P-ring protein FlgI